MGRRRVVFLLLLVPMIEAGLVAQEVQLRIIATGVSSGGITSPPIEVDLGERRGLVLSTEDRVLRFLDPEREFEIAIPLGFQVRAPLYRRDPPLFVLFGDRLAMGRADFTRGRAVPVRSAFDQTYGWTPSDRGGFPVAQFDRNGNIYLFSGTTRVVHMSAAGTVFWARDLPSIPVDLVDAGGVVYAALENGLVMRFDEHGTGESIIRLPSAPVSLGFDPAPGSGALLLTEAVGRLSRYSLAGEEPRREWTREIPAQGDGGPPRILAVAGRSCFVRTGDRVFAVDRYGADRWTAEAAGAVQPLDDERVLVVSGDGVISLVTRDGVERVAETGRSPLAFDLLPRSSALFFRYQDWSWELWALDRAATDRADSGRRPVAVSREPEPTALAGLVGLALESSSSARRERVLAIVEERLDAAELYGDVTTARRLATSLLTEVSRGGDSLDRPDIRRRAATILGRYLDDASRVSLLRVVRDDPDPSVVAEAVRGLAGWGIETPDASAVLALRFAREGDRGRHMMAEPAVRYLESLEGSKSEEFRGLAVLLAGSDIDTALRRRAVSAARQVLP